MKSSKRLTIIMLACAFVLAASAGIITIWLNTKYAMGPSPFDFAVQEAFFALRSDFLNSIVVAVTHCGDTITIIVLCLLLLLLPNRLQYGLPVSIAALGGVAIYKPMKHSFLRARPDQLLHLVEQGGYSFPSGHSVTSIVVYGLLIYLIQKHCQNGKLKTPLTIVCLLFALLIGPSRIFVGVHWPTDVLCGWLIGGAILLIAITILERIYNKNENI